MKKTLLTTTALVALAGAATAEITVTGTAAWVCKQPKAPQRLKLLLAQ